jgi:parallel beta-helix repeat protein
MKRIMILVLGLMMLPALAVAATIHVPADQPTIQAGIDAAVNGDTVIVSQGTYLENVRLYGKNILLISETGRDFTFIEPAIQSVPIVKFIDNEDSTSVIDGFTIRNVAASFGIYCEGASPIIRDCDISYCRFDGDGTGIFLRRSSAKIRYNRIHHNDGGSTGGGIGGTEVSNTDISWNEIYSNSASNGPGIGLHGTNSDVQVCRNIIYNNTSAGYVGGGIYIYGHGCFIRNNTLSGNSQGITLLDGSSTDIRNNIVVQSTREGISPGSATCDYNDAWRNGSANNPGPNGIIVDPLFHDAPNDDYHLSTGSPCINTGDPASTYNDPDGSRNDMGTFPYEPPNRPPVIAPISSMTNYEGDTVSLEITATDPDMTIPALTAFDLPMNAIFANSGNGRGSFYWPIAPKQYGTFNILFIASDGVLADTETSTIEVLVRPPQIENLAVAGSLLPWNVTAHLPRITWDYLDFNNDDPQSEFEIAVGIDSDWVSAEMWNPSPFTSGVASVFYAGEPLIDGATYWLRLRVNNSIAWSDWKQLMFRMNSIPTIPELRLPFAEGIAPSQQPGLAIRNSTDAENDSLLYTFDVSPDNFATTVFTFTKKQDADSLTTLIVDSTLVENGQYWWRVKANDYYESSEYSPARSFYVNSTNTAPTAVSLTQPANTTATPLTILRPQFVWTASTDPDPWDTTKYDLLIAIDSDFMFVQQIPNLTTTSHTLASDLLWGLRYWWKVRSVDRQGAFGWSPVSAFRTVTLGDANNDGAADISDVVYLVAYIFSGGLPPNPLLAGDANCDTSVDISDVVYLIAYIFSGGAPPCSAF